MKTEYIACKGQYTVRISDITTMHITDQNAPDGKEVTFKGEVIRYPARYRIVFELGVNDRKLYWNFSTKEARDRAWDQIQYVFNEVTTYISA
jgi:hypothetical protein